MWTDGADLRKLPLIERRSRLAKLLRKAKRGIRFSEHIEADSAKVFAHACELGLEGIVSKRRDIPLSIPALQIRLARR